MPAANSSTRAAQGGEVIYINLWAQSGMKHYSESLMHALAPAAPVIYVRNYESRLDVPSLRVNLEPVQLPAPRELWRIARAISRRRVLAVHINSEAPALLALFPLLLGQNAVITLHDAVPHAGEKLSKRLFMRVHLALLFCFFRKVIVHSPTIRDRLPAWLQPRVRLLPHVNYRLWAPGESAPSKPRGTRCRILFFGRILRYKGLDHLLTAFRQLDPARFELVIAGEGEVPSIDAPNIRVINRFISDEEMGALFGAADVVALPYLAASQSGVAYMAFAFEKPVVATRVGGLAEVVRDDVNGFLIEPASPDPLAAALRRAAEPDTHARLVANIQRQQLSADEEIRERLLAIYRE